MSGLRTIFMGTPEFACPTLQKLIDRNENILAVITQPDRPKGRGQKLMPPPVKELALTHAIPVYQPIKVRDPEFVEIIREMKPDVIVVVAFGQILPKALLDIPPMGCINVHASLLPRYRGAAPLNWCLIDGEKETGVTTMLMDVGLDTGPMLLKRVAPLDENEDIVSLHDRMSIMGAELLGETLDGVVDGSIKPEQQDDSLTCYASMLKKEHGLINWQHPAVEIHNQIRGLAVWPCAYTYLDGQVIKIYRSRVGQGNGPAGTVLPSPKGMLEVACQSGSLFLDEMQLSGKKRLDSASFLSGCPIADGTLLGVNIMENE